MTENLALPSEFETAGIACGVKASGKSDLALFVSRRDCVAAGVFTQNRVVGAPVIVSRERVPATGVRAVVINSGNSNACTGERGLNDARRMTALVAEQFDLQEAQVLVCSTGVIGHFLPMDKITSGIAQAARQLGGDGEHLQAAAKAIMTTDTVPKIVTHRVDGINATVTGVAKGAAMIAPNMATMLSVIMTDAPLSQADAQAILQRSVSRTFNCISVEGHTSTSDTVLLLANGDPSATLSDEDRQSLEVTIERVCRELSQKIIRDAEGAEHFVTVKVTGLPTEEDCHQIAKAVCDSPLVKTAITGNDPNWGRIVSAAGYAGVPFQESDLSLIVNGVVLYETGRPLDFDDAAVSASMKTGEVTMELRFRLGTAEITCWTCDLTAEYIRLNADYTT